jgi:uncharacterized repeat protein (TIGR02543 family)
MCWSKYIPLPSPDGLSSIGDFAFQGFAIASITIPGKVARIGNNAFQNCTGFTSVTIPAGVTSIGVYAFRGCTGLTQVTFDAANCTAMGSRTQPVFSGCTALKWLNTGNGATRIPDYAFYGTEISVINISEGITSIGDSAFYNCSGASTTLGSKVADIGNYAFYGCTGMYSISIPAGVTSIGTHVFTGCSYLNAINVADGNTHYSSTGGVLFNRDKTALLRHPEYKSDTYTIPAAVTSIADHAFQNCTRLEAVELPATVTTVGTSAFAGCADLLSVTVQATAPPAVAADALSNCLTGMVRLKTPQGTETAYSQANVWKDFYIEGVSSLPTGTCGPALTWTYDMNGTLNISGSGDMYNYSGTLEGTSFWETNTPWNGWRRKIRTVVFPDRLTSIGNYSFPNCVNLRSMTIPDGVTTIGDEAFYFAGLTTVTIPQSVTVVKRAGLCAFTLNEVIVADGAETLVFNNNLYTDGNNSPIHSYRKVYIGRNIVRDGNYTWSLFMNEPEEVIIGNTVTDITNYAFADNKYLRRVTLGSSVTTIGNYAFKNATGLKFITSLAAVPPPVNAGIFEGVDMSCARLYVPSASLELYRAAEAWKDFNMVAISTSITDLASVSVSGRTLSPDFCPDITDYYCTVPGNIGTATIWASAFDPLGTVSGAGARTLATGDNVFPVVVTAQDGVTTKTYRITITRQEGEVTDCTVTFNAQGGSAVASQNAGEDGRITQPANPTRAGYTFGGWYKEAACTTPWNFTTDAVTANITLYAKWIEEGVTTYTVTFNTQGGSTITPQTVEQGGKVQQPASPTREGYTFGGWHKEAACTTTWNFDTDAVNGNITLYAKWTEGDVTGVPELDAPDLKVYPNPFTGILHLTGISAETWHAASLQVINAAGVVVHTQKIVNPDETIRLEHLPAGVYFFRIEKDGRAKTLKVIKN